MANDSESTTAKKAARTGRGGTSTARRTATRAADTTKKTAERAEGTVVSALPASVQKMGERGREAAVSLGKTAVGKASTAYTVIKNRKLIAAGAGVGIASLASGAFLAGQRTARAGQGPITRYTGGRF